MTSIAGLPGKRAMVQVGPPLSRRGPSRGSPSGTMDVNQFLSSGFAKVGVRIKLDGKVVEEALDKIGLTLNKNAIANDTLPPFRPSGIRLGTPAITTRGLTEAHMPQLAAWMRQAVDAHEDEATLATLRAEVTSFALGFPLPSDV